LAQSELQQRVAAVRRFNRFYTHRMGVLHEGHLSSPYSLSEVRVLYELAHRKRPTASELGRELGLDAGYLSRMLRDFEKRGLLARKSSETDGRQSLLSLTPKGREAFAALDERASEEVGAMLGALPPEDQPRVVEAMRTLQTLLGGESEAKSPVILRSHQAGDMGWVVHRHGVLYAREYGWGEPFEALVADVVAKFLQEHEPKRERCWIAEKDGQNVGSVFLVEQSKTVARLRLLLVEPKARGLGVGRSLVSECLRFARQAGYRKVTLWTNSLLHAARHLYEEAGFMLVHEEPHPAFGKGSLGQSWDLTL
jgi:DNA-binding MarR family transcriptional regulator/N-acetylglutamate synthase-like GNAT family acetyltransferase